MKAPDWLWIVTAFVAVYGAFLSTYNVYISRKQNRRQVNVRLSKGFLTQGPELSEDMLILTAANSGHRPVTLTGVGFILPDKRQVILQAGNVDLPHTLAEGTSCTHWTPLAAMVHQLHESGFSQNIRIKAFYRDATDVTHLSEPFHLDLTK